MNYEDAWQSVLRQLQIEMSRVVGFDQKAAFAEKGNTKMMEYGRGTGKVLYFIHGIMIFVLPSATISNLDRFRTAFPSGQETS